MHDEVQSMPSSPVLSDSWIYVSAPDPGKFGDIKDRDFGKWCIVRPAAAIDDAWAIVSSLVTDNKVIHAKVSTPRQARHFSSTHLICVYTPRWYDTADVMRVRNLLRESGFTEELGYKRDLDTIAGVYGTASEWWYRS